MDFLVMTTSWCRPDSIWAQVGAKAPSRDLTPAQIREAIAAIREKSPDATIGLTTGFLQNSPAMDFTGLEGVRLWIEKGPELSENLPLIERAVEKGLKIDFVLQQPPKPEELEILGRFPRESLRAICCFRTHLPLPILFDELKTLFADWRIWAPPAPRCAKSFVTGRELFFWRKWHPDLSRRLVFFEGDSPRSEQAPAYLRDGVSDPFDLAGSSFFERVLVQALLRQRARPEGFVFAFLLLFAELMGFSARDRVKQGLWVLPGRGLRLGLRFSFLGLERFLTSGVYGWFWRRLIVGELYWRIGRGWLWKEYGVALKRKYWHGWLQEKFYWTFFNPVVIGKARVFFGGVVWKRVLVAGLYWRVWRGFLVGRVGVWLNRNVWHAFLVRGVYWKFIYRWERGHLRDLLYGVVWKRILVGGVYWKFYRGVVRGDLQVFFHGIVWKRFVVGVLYWKVYRGILRGRLTVLFHGIVWKRFVVGVLYWKFYRGFVRGDLQVFFQGIVWKRFVVGVLYWKVYHGIVRGDLKVLFHGYFWRRFFVGTVYWKWYHHSFRGDVWPLLTFPIRKVYWFTRYQYRKRIGTGAVG